MTRARTAVLVLVALLLGVAVGAALAGGAPAPPTGSPPSGTVGPTASADPPAEACLAAAGGSEAVLRLAEEAAEAMADTDARRLQEVVDRMRAEDAAVREAARRCRAAERGPAPPTRSAARASSSAGSPTLAPLVESPTS